MPPTEWAVEAVRDYDAEEPVLGHAVLIVAYNAGLVGLLALLVRRDRLPERVEERDLLLLGVATHKVSRLLTKDRVTAPLRAPFTVREAEGKPGEVSDRPRGGGARRAIGQLLVCPFCISQWVATGFAVGLALAPRATRLLATIFVLVSASDALQAAYRWGEGKPEPEARGSQ